jgi:hypothetical protein
MTTSDHSNMPSCNPQASPLHDGWWCRLRRRKWCCHHLPPSVFRSRTSESRAACTACIITQSRANIVGQVIILPNLTLYEGLHDTSCLRVCLRSSNGTRMNRDESRAKESSSACRSLNLNQHHVQHASLRQVLPVVQV